MNELRREKSKLLVATFVFFAVTVVILGIEYVFVRQARAELEEFLLESGMPVIPVALPLFIRIVPFLVLFIGPVFTILNYSWIRHWERRIILLGQSKEAGNSKSAAYFNLQGSGDLEKCKDDLGNSSNNC